MCQISVFGVLGGAFAVEENILFQRQEAFAAAQKEKEVGEAISKVCKLEGVTIIRAATLPDHVHMYVSIPPKESVAKIVGRIKGKSSLMLFDRHPEYRDRYGRHFWAKGYYCETIGNVNEETIKKYIEEQYENDRLEGES